MTVKAMIPEELTPEKGYSPSNFAFCKSLDVTCCGLLWLIGMQQREPYYDSKGKIVYETAQQTKERLKAEIAKLLDENTYGNHGAGLGRGLAIITIADYEKEAVELFTQDGVPGWFPMCEPFVNPRTKHVCYFYGYYMFKKASDLVKKKTSSFVTTERPE